MRALSLLVFFFLATLVASNATHAQSSPGLSYGQIPTAAQWNSYFSAKQDYLGFTPLNGQALGGYVFCNFTPGCSASSTIPVGNISGFFPLTIAASPVAGTCPNGDVLYNNSGVLGCLAPAGSGTVTSISITVPSFLAAAGCTITTFGTCAITTSSQSSNLFLASPDGSSGASVMRAIVVGDINGLSPAFAGLSASGTVSGAGFSNYLASPPSIGGTVPGSVKATTLGAATSLTVGAGGLVGDGVTNNNTALQAAFTAAASGGKIQIPCGKYVITATLTVTVASGSQFDLGGSGQNCTSIIVQGGIGGMVVTQTDETSGISLHDFALTTNQAGGQIGITIIKNTANVLFAYAVPISINNVSEYGSDYPSLPASYPTKYWSTGFQLKNVNLVAMNNPFFVGGTCAVSGPQVLCNGNAITYTGNASLTSYGVVLNVFGANIGLCNNGFTYGDYTQGVTLSHINVTGCQNGVVVAGGVTGALDQIEIDGSQFNNYVSNINLTSTGTTLNSAIISNNLFIPQNNVSNLILNNDTYFTVTGNIFYPNLTGTTGILLSGTNIRGVINNNNITGEAVGIKVPSSAIPASTNIGAGNVIVGNTLDYSISSSLGGGSSITISDSTLRSISNIITAIPCNANIQGSRTVASDTTFLATPTYRSNLAGSGAVSATVPVVCNSAGAWIYD